MYRTQCVLALLSVYAGLVHTFSWEFVIGKGGRLEFYDINGTQTHTENVTSSEIESVTYDPVHNRVLFAAKRNIYSFEIASKTIECLVRRNPSRLFFISLAYDPATEVLFWSESLKNIYSMSLKPGFNNKTEDKHLVMSENGALFIDIDSCGGFIYWITRYYKTLNLQRARFNGSDREVVFDFFDSSNFKIDQQTQKIYWFEEEIDENVMLTARTSFTHTGYMKSADLNGKNIRTLLTYPEFSGNLLTISKDLIYVKNGGSFWTIPKSPASAIDMQPTFLMEHDGGYLPTMVANYNVEDLSRGIQNCEALTNLLPNNTATNISSDGSLLCVHGAKVSGESRCECTQGYSGERCDVPVCHNYCFRGDCSVSAEGQPKCRCYAGYSGERCEVHACQGYCLNSGVCSLNENSQPVCQCSGDYGGERCDIPVFVINMKKRFKSVLRGIPNKDVTTVTEDKKE